jgi:ribosomal protein S18 acetylase RimI-like enzyme
MITPGITALERVAATHWQAAEQVALGEWLLRADGGFTGRANSALPLGDPGMPLASAVDRVEQWYLGRELPPMIAIAGPLDPATRADDPLDGLLAARGWRVRSGPAVVMTAQADAVTGPDGAGPRSRASGLLVTLAARPDAAWLARYHYRGMEELPPSALRLLMSAPWQAFASVVASGQTVAVGRVSTAAGWAGITAIDVAPGHRRRGLGSAVTAGLAAEAARRGIGQVFLQVEEGNAAARALYERCGFAAVHRYHYRVAPGPGRGRSRRRRIDL